MDLPLPSIVKTYFSEASCLIGGLQRNEFLPPIADQRVKREPCLRKRSVDHGTNSGVRVGRLLWNTEITVMYK